LCSIFIVSHIQKKIKQQQNLSINRIGPARLARQGRRFDVGAKYTLAGAKEIEGRVRPPGAGREEETSASEMVLPPSPKRTVEDACGSLGTPVPTCDTLARVGQGCLRQPCASVEDRLSPTSRLHAGACRSRFLAKPRTPHPPLRGPPSPAGEGKGAGCGRTNVTPPPRARSAQPL